MRALQPLVTTSVVTRLVLLILLLLILQGMISISPVEAATLPLGFTEAQIAGNLPNPTAMAFAPDGRLFVCQQGGALRVIKDGALLPAPFVVISVSSSGERGLLGVAFDPDFATNQFIYLYYTTSTTPIRSHQPLYSQRRRGGRGQRSRHL